MKIDVTLLGISGNSLRWLRRLAPWSIVPIILGALVLATVALGSVRYNGEAYNHAWDDGQRNRAQPALSDPVQVVEQPLTSDSVTIHVNKAIQVLTRPDWSPVKITGPSLQQSAYLYVATKPGKAVLTAHHGSATWKYTVHVIPAAH